MSKQHLSSASASALWRLAKDSAECRHKNNVFLNKSDKNIYALGFFEGAEAATKTSVDIALQAKIQRRILGFLLFYSNIVNIAWLLAHITRP